MKTLLIPFSCILLLFFALAPKRRYLLLRRPSTTFSHLFLWFFLLFCLWSFFYFLLFLSRLCLHCRIHSEGKIIHHILAHGQTLQQINFSSRRCCGDLKEATTSRREKIKNSSCFRNLLGKSHFKMNLFSLATINTNGRKKRQKNVFLKDDH
jgi:hypothetical protein